MSNVTKNWTVHEHRTVRSKTRIIWSHFLDKKYKIIVSWAKHNIKIHLLLLVFKLQFSHVVFHTEKLFCHYVVVQLHFKTTFPNCNLMNSLSSSNPQKPTRIHYDFIIVWEKKQISKKYFFLKFNIGLNSLMNALVYVNIDHSIQ